MPSPDQNRVRARREALGISQGALAATVELSRQSIGAIEAGRATPSVDAALRLARALATDVESLFGDGPAQDVLVTEPEQKAMSGRVAVANVRGRWVSYPIAKDALHRSADALVTRATKGRLGVSLMRPTRELYENVVLMGCASGLAMLADRLNAGRGPGRFVWLPRASTAALSALATERTHLAGVHLVDPKSGEANVPDVRRLVGRAPHVLVTLGRWDAGLVLAASNPKGVRGVADLGRAGLRVALREEGSGARRLFDSELRREGVVLDDAGANGVFASGHVEVARAVALGVADVGMATRDAALAFGLDFVPVAEERYDLVLPVPLVTDARMARLFDVLTSAAFRRELSAVGYDVSGTGARVAEVSA